MDIKTKDGFYLITNMINLNCMLQLFLEINQWHSHSTLFGSYMMLLCRLNIPPYFIVASALLFPAPGTVQKNFLLQNCMYRKLPLVVEKFGMYKC